MVLVALSAMREAQSRLIIYGYQMPDTSGVERLNRHDILPAQPGNESASGHCGIVRKKHRRDKDEQKANSFGSHINRRTALGAQSQMRRWPPVNDAMLTVTRQ